MTPQTHQWLAPMLQALIIIEANGGAFLRFMELSLTARDDTSGHVTLDWIRLGQMMREELGWTNYPTHPPDDRDEVGADDDRQVARAVPGMRTAPRPGGSAWHSGDRRKDSFSPSVAHVVLHIDDDDDVRRLIERALLRRADFDLVSASRGLVGLELARVHQPAVVLLDMQLPDINGDEVLRRLRDDPLTCDSAVIMVSGEYAPELIQRMLESGAVAYITKPFDVRVLVARIDEVIGKRIPSLPYVTE